MSRMDKLSTYKTTINTDKHGTHIVYVSTRIVSFDAHQVTLRSGGWETVTTKRKMNQASNQFGLGFYVRQHKGKWSVRFRDGRASVAFFDGMRINRPRNPGVSFRLAAALERQRPTPHGRTAINGAMEHGR